MLDVSAQMLGKYLSGARPAEVKELLKGTGSAQHLCQHQGRPANSVASSKCLEKGTSVQYMLMMSDGQSYLKMEPKRKYL